MQSETGDLIRPRCRRLANSTKHTRSIWFWPNRSIMWNVIRYPKKNWRTDKRTDRRTLPVALPSRLMQSVNKNRSVPLARSIDPGGESLSLPMNLVSQFIQFQFIYLSTESWYSRKARIGHFSLISFARGRQQYRKYTEVWSLLCWR